MVEKSEPAEPVLDLFGQPWLAPRDPRGRKSHRWSMEVAEKIALLRATGASLEEAAAAVGLSVPTAKKYYFRELEEGDSLVRQAVIAAQLKAALKGSTSAAKFIRDELDKGQLVETAYRGPGAKPIEPKAERVGKKEQRQLTAEQVSAGVFAPGPPPARLN